MSNLYIKTFPGRPVETVLWSVVSIIGVFGGLIGIGGLYYSIFPTLETDVASMHIFAIVGIPVMIVALVLQKVIEKRAVKINEEE